MKFVISIFLLSITLATSAFSDDKNATNINQCPGPWVLKNYGGWIVHNQNGTILPLSANTRLLDCKTDETSLTPSLDGADVLVECSLPEGKQKLPEVKNIILICK
ncbi:hypothetical protein NLA06_17050 [Desulfomicrobium sp. ZS1]|uniref:hypothetical protein n=1 Tax=Desulfomicrobium sp. ZS1 TaxID=2952228 RepID=UPI0020B25638|nr:hypothetical protein [Desulfomicrobium sp. ZS1]UTF50237.1 hypothetical protein NLA06_17050 [Desulfomicrobium sp. ZS1]